MVSLEEAEQLRDTIDNLEMELTEVKAQLATKGDAEKRLSEFIYAKMIPPGIKPETLSVLDSRDNRYTMESAVVGVHEETGVLKSTMSKLFPPWNQL